MKQISGNTQKPGYFMKQIKIVFLVSVFIILIAFTAYAKESGCVKCHTDEKMLKSLVVVPKISEEAGGG
jgi:hypothetical protein